MHQGERLDLFLRINKIQKDAFAKKIGVGRGTVYNMIRDKIIKKEHMDAIRKAGYDFDAFVHTNVQTGAQVNESTTPHNLSSPEQQIANLRELLAEKQKVIDAQERIIKWQEHYFNKPRKALAQAIKPRPQ